MYRENLELRIILDVFCRQLTVLVRSGKLGALASVLSVPATLKPVLKPDHWTGQETEDCGRAHSSDISRAKGTEGLHEHTVGQDHIVGQDPRSRTVNLRLIFVKSVWSG